MDATDVVDAIKACSSLVNDARAELVIFGVKMNINLIYRHPCELEIESLLGSEEPYPDTSTPQIARLNGLPERAQVWFM